MMKLRPYQNEAVNAVCNDWQNEGYHRTLVVLPTGCGKTVIFASVIARAVRKGRRALVIAHRDELLAGLFADQRIVVNHRKIPSFRSLMKQRFFIIKNSIP